jgi:hypothetical protein
MRMLQGYSLMYSAETTLPKVAIRRYSSSVCTSAPDRHTKSRYYFLINDKSSFNVVLNLGGTGDPSGRRCGLMGRRKEGL